MQLNFATEFLADEAIARARELDQHYKRTGELVGPLVSGNLFHGQTLAFD